MKKRVTIILEVESDDEINMSDDFIRSDLEQEINCASNFYDIIDFKTEIVDYEKKQKTVDPKEIDTETVLKAIEHCKTCQCNGCPFRGQGSYCVAVLEHLVKNGWRV